jgi:hypothetical protein
VTAMELEAEAESYATGPQPLVTVPVHAEGQDNSGGHQGVHFTMTVSASVNQVVQLLGRDYDRVEARVLATGGTGDVEVIPANPAAGAQWVYTMPYAATVLSLTFIYTASATVGTRFVAVYIEDPAGNQLVQVPVSSGTVASTAVEPFLSSSSPYTGINAQFSSYAPFPAQVIPAGYKIAISVQGGVLAGDQISGIFMVLAPSAAGVWLSQSKEIAESIATQGTGYAGPAGSLLPPGTDRLFRNCDELWATALSPLSVSLSAIVSRRLPVARPTFA